MQDVKCSTRVHRIVAKQNILIISELRLEDGDSEQIQKLFNDWHVKIILIHRKAISSYDNEFYQINKSQLEPMLMEIVDTAECLEPDEKDSLVLSN